MSHPLFPPTRGVWHVWCNTPSRINDPFHVRAGLPFTVGYRGMPQVYIGGGGELATAREVLRHKSVEKCVMVDLDKVGAHPPVALLCLYLARVGHSCVCCLATRIPNPAHLILPSLMSKHLLSSRSFLVPPSLRVALASPESQSSGTSGRMNKFEQKKKI